jgi:hypothetical protein
LFTSSDVIFNFVFSFSFAVKFFVCDFNDGTQIVPRNWLSKDMEYCAWPPWWQKVDQRGWDRRVQALVEPDEDWSPAPVLRVRAYGGNVYRSYSLLFFIFLITFP